MKNAPAPTTGLLSLSDVTTKREAVLAELREQEQAIQQLQAQIQQRTQRVFNLQGAALLLNEQEQQLTGASPTAG